MKVAEEEGVDFVLNARTDAFSLNRKGDPAENLATPSSAARPTSTRAPRWSSCRRCSTRSDPRAGRRLRPAQLTTIGIPGQPAARLAGGARRRADVVRPAVAERRPHRAPGAGRGGAPRRRYAGQPALPASAPDGRRCKVAATPCVRRCCHDQHTTPSTASSPRSARARGITTAAWADDARLDATVPHWRFERDGRRRRRGRAVRLVRRPDHHRVRGPAPDPRRRGGRARPELGRGRSAARRAPGAPDHRGRRPDQPRTLCSAAAAGRPRCWPRWRPLVATEAAARGSPSPWTSSSRAPPTGSRSAPPTRKSGARFERLTIDGEPHFLKVAVGRGRLDHAGHRQHHELGVPGLAGRDLRRDARRSSTTRSSAWRSRGPAVGAAVDPDDRLRRRPGAARRRPDPGGSTTSTSSTHMAAMHAHFMGWHDDLGLQDLSRRLLFFAPETIAPELEVADVPGPDRGRRTRAGRLLPERAPRLDDAGP